VRRALAVVVVALVAGAFLAGYWPQRERASRSAAEAAQTERRLAELRGRLAELEARDRLSRLFGQLLALDDAVASRDWARAQALSSAFFDAVGDEAGRPDASPVRGALDAVLVRRDTVTAGIARGDASVREVLVPVAWELRRALGFSVPPLVPARPTTEERPS
jgi:hypothetical protein